MTLWFGNGRPKKCRQYSKEKVRWKQRNGSLATKWNWRAMDKAVEKMVMTQEEVEVEEAAKVEEEETGEAEVAEEEVREVGEEGKEMKWLYRKTPEAPEGPC